MKRSIDWFQLSRMSRLSRVMFPNLASAEDQRDMSALCHGEGKRSPTEALADREKARLEQQKRRW